MMNDTQAFDPLDGPFPEIIIINVARANDASPDADPGRDSRGMDVALTRPMSRLEIMFGILIGLVLAAIGCVQLQRAAVRSGEAAARADTQRVISAQQTYASANGGYFDDISRMCRSGPECLGIGIPGYPADEPEFLEPELARPTPYRKDHYVREWTGLGQPTTLPEGVSPTSVFDYCYTATPGNWFVRHGQSFAGAGSGAVALDPAGEPFPCPFPAPHWE